MALATTQDQDLETKMATILSSLQSLHHRLDDMEQRIASTTVVKANNNPSSPAHKKPKKTEGSVDSSRFYKAMLHILYAVLSEDEDGGVPYYTFPNLTPTCIDLLSQPDAATFSTMWRAAHNTAKHKAKQEKSALSSLASGQFIVSTVHVKKVLSGSIFNLPIGQLKNLSTWKNDWTLAHFATPIENQDWTSFVQQQRDEVNSDLQYQPDSIHATRKNFNLFIQGHFDQSLDTILSCLANFIVFSTTLVSIPNPWDINPANPLIINLFLELSNYLIQGDNKSALTGLSKTNPHLFFVIFGFFQDILSEMGQIMSAGDAVNIAMALHDADDAAISSTLFENLEKQAKDSHDELKKLVRTQTSPPAPSSFTIVHPPQVITPPNQKPAAAIQPDEHHVHVRGQKGGYGKGNGNVATVAEALIQALANAQQGKGIIEVGEKKKHNEAKGDWLEITAGTSFHALLPFPKGLYFCLKHAIKGVTCPNKQCRNKHLHYSDLTAEQKTLLETRLSEVNKDAVRFSISK